MVKLHFPEYTKNMSNNRLIATLMVVVTLTISISFVLCRLWFKDISFTNQVIKKKNLVNATLEQNMAALPTLQQNFQALETNGPAAGDVLKALPTTPDYATFSKEVEAMAALAGSQLLSVVLQSAANIDAPATSGSQVTSPIEVVYAINVSGRYSDLQKFLRNLETAKRPVRITTFTLSGTEPSVSLQINVATHYQAVTIVGNDKEVVTE